MLSLVKLAVASVALVSSTGAISLPKVVRQTTLPADCARNTTVHLGETCDIISATFNVSTFQLAFVNNGTIDASCDNLAVGEPLCLGITGQDCTETHVIVSGDGCDTISAAAGIPESTLLANNPNINSGCTNIYPDEVLCIDSQIYNYTSSS